MRVWKGGAKGRVVANLTGFCFLVVCHHVEIISNRNLTTFLKLSVTIGCQLQHSY